VLEAMKAMIRLVIKDLRARKIVPSAKPRPSAPQPTLAREAGASLESQVHRHLVAEPPAIEAALPAPLPPASAKPSIGPVAALAPAALIDQARVAEVAFSAGDFDACVRTALETLQRGLAFAGEASVAHQAFLLGLNGRDVLDVWTRAQRGAAHIEDASFALYVLSQLFVRLTQAGLPTPEQ
jgi:hypothetical protein